MLAQHYSDYFFFFRDFTFGYSAEISVQRRFLSYLEVQMFQENECIIERKSTVPAIYFISKH